MAEITVERKKAFPWWAWLLIALAILLLIWAFLGRDRDEVAEGMRQRTAPVDEGVGAITSAAVLFNVDNPDAFVGRQVNIQNARVLNVSGDRTFWIGEGEGSQVLVVLDEEATPQHPRVEGRYDVNPGQNIAILEGVVQRFPGWEEARSRWNADPNLRSNFENQQVYIQAQKLEIKEWQEGKAPVQTQPR